MHFPLRIFFIIIFSLPISKAQIPVNKKYIDSEIIDYVIDCQSSVKQVTTMTENHKYINFKQLIFCAIVYSEELQPAEFAIQPNQI